MAGGGWCEFDLAGAALAIGGFIDIGPGLAIGRDLHGKRLGVGGFPDDGDADEGNRRRAVWSVPKIDSAPSLIADPISTMAISAIR